MAKDIKVFKSRTVIVLTIIVLTNLANAYVEIVPAVYMLGINVVLSTLAGYFRVNTKQTF